MGKSWDGRNFRKRMRQGWTNWISELSGRHLIVHPILPIQNHPIVPGK